MANSYRSVTCVFVFLALVSVFATPAIAGNGNGNGKGNGNGSSNGSGNGSGFGKLWLNISDSYYADVWDNETNIYNGTDFKLNITNTGSELSRNTTLITSLHPLTYPGLISVSVNGHVIPQSEFGYGTPGWNKCEGGFHYFPSHGIFPANYSLYDLGNIPAGGSVLVTINISSSSPNPKTHFDAVGFAIKNGSLCWDLKTPNSHDAGTNGSNVPFFPSALIPLAIGLAVPAAAYRLAR